MLSAVVTGGCGSSAGTAADASPDDARVTALAEEAFRQLPPGATLKVMLEQPEIPCDRGPADTTFTEIEYIVDHPRGWPVEQVIPVLAGYWAHTGYTIVDDERDDRQVPVLRVEHPGGFRIAASLVRPEHGRVAAYLVSSSTCR